MTSDGLPHPPPRVLGARPMALETWRAWGPPKAHGRTLPYPDKRRAPCRSIARAFPENLTCMIVPGCRGGSDSHTDLPAVAPSGAVRRAPIPPCPSELRGPTGVPMVRCRRHVEALGQLLSGLGARGSEVRRSVVLRVVAFLTTLRTLSTLIHSRRPPGRGRARGRHGRGSYIVVVYSYYS